MIDLRPLRRTQAAGFTLVELLVSTAIIALLLLVLVTMTNQTSQTWRYTTSKIEQFQGARDGFEAMTRRLSQATLNTYWDVSFKSGGAPDKYIRQSELRFICGPMSKLVVGGGNARPTDGIFFQAPLGFVNDQNKYGAMDNLLNTWGYFVEVGDSETTLPPFLSGKFPKRWRSRLMELMQPAENMSVYTASGSSDTKWFSGPIAGTARPVRTLAENVTALVILPKLAKQEQDARDAAGKEMLAPQYFYDSTLVKNPGAKGGDPEVNPKNQLPPVLQVTMVAIDAQSAQRLVDANGSKDDLGIKMTSLFTDARKLEDNPATSTPGDGDLAEYEKLLVNQKVTYRIFTTNVSIRGAKWSKAQTD